MEQYKPSEEEMKKAEESMTEEQKIKSDVRGKYYQQREEIGIQIPEDLLFDMDAYKGAYIKGSFNGHYVDIAKETETVDYGNTRSRISRNPAGTIDGKPLTSEEAEKLWEKLVPVVKTLKSEEDEASKELSALESKRRREEEQKKFEESRIGIEGALADLGL